MRSDKPDVCGEISAKCYPPTVLIGGQSPAGNGENAVLRGHYATVGTPSDRRASHSTTRHRLDQIRRNFRYQKIEIRVAMGMGMGMGMRGQVDRRVFEFQREIISVIQIECAQEILVGLAFA